MGIAQEYQRETSGTLRYNGGQAPGQGRQPVLAARRARRLSERYRESKLILIWGSNAVTSNLHFWARALEAKRRGARLVAIDPYRSATALKCHEHIALLPGTDAALA